MPNGSKTDIIPIFLGKTVSEPDAYHVAAGGTLSVDAAQGLLLNDYTNRGSISVTGISEPAHGSLSLLGDGSFSYVPDAGFTGIDTFTYYSSDGYFEGTSSATVTLEVYAPALVAESETYTVQAGQTLDLEAPQGLLENDLSTSGTVDATSFSTPEHGTLSVSLTGSFTYTPDPGFVGVDSFTYYISNSFGTAYATDYIDVTDSPPVANNDHYSMRAGGTLIVDAASGLLANDSDAGETFDATSFSDASHGDLSVSLTGAFTYVPTPGFVGLDSFTYYVGNGTETAFAIGYVDVVDTAPVAVADHYTDAENSTLTVDAAHGLLANDYDADGDQIEATSFSEPSHGSLSVSLTGAFTYSPDPGYVGTDTFTYYISDGALTSFATATVTTELNTGSDIVIANPDEYAVIEGGSLVVDGAQGLLANDYGNHGTIDATAFSSPSHGSLDVSLDGSITYTPDPGFVGTDHFTYYISDGTVTSSSTVALGVYANTPVAVADTFTVQAGHTLDVEAPQGLLENDLSTSGTVLASSFSTPEHGTLSVSITGAITYTPDPGFVGTDSFTYYVSNGFGTAYAVDSIVVTDSTPVANNDHYSMRAGGTLVVNAPEGLLANDSEQGGTLDATSFSDASHGDLSVSITGAFTYVPTPGFVGTDSFTYYVGDGTETAFATASIDVVDTAPVANNDYYHMYENGVITINAGHGLLANDFDPDGDAIDVTSFSDAAHGDLSVSLTGAFTYTPDAGFVGIDMFTYYISDGVLGTYAVAEIDVIACFVTGTMILTSGGEVAVEDLRIGDAVRTLHAGLQKIKWIGRRSYVAPFANNEKILPVCIQAGAIGDGVPARDLRVSPGHAICIDDALFHAGRLVNHVSITQAESVAAITYYHIELENHEVIFADGCPAETFMDESFRAQFQNADEFHALYPEGVAAQMPCLPRHDGGLALGAMQRRLAARAGIAETAGLGALRGYVDGAGPERCFGWAQDEAAPERAVYLDIFVAERRIGRVLANLFRADVRDAGFGSGYCGFEFLLPAGLAGLVSVKRAADGAVLAMMPAVVALAA